MSDPVTVERAGGIPIGEWSAYVSRSPFLKRPPSHEAINPFTKEKITVPPALGSAVFETFVGTCSVNYRKGILVFDGGGEAATPIIQVIATALGADLKLHTGP